jgi:DNA-binding response OmpR family regulator
MGTPPRLTRRLEQFMLGIAPAVSGAKVPEGRRKRILLAEDDAAIAALLTKVLGRTYDLVHATDGEKALGLAAQQPPPDLLLLDVMMPALDGLTVAARVRALPHLKNVPIIFLTAKTGATDVIRGIQSGARHYIQKPFKIDEVVAKVKKTIGE